MKSMEKYYIDSMDVYPADVIKAFCETHHLFLVIHNGKVEKIVDGQERVICEKGACL